MLTVVAIQQQLSALGSDSIRLPEFLSLTEKVVADEKAEHDKAEASALASGASIAEGKPGHHAYQAEPTALKKCLSAAFSVASSKSGPVLDIHPLELPELFSLLVGRRLVLDADEHEGWVLENLASGKPKTKSGPPVPGVFARCIAGMATHSSRYANTSTSTRLEAHVPENPLPYVCSATVKSPVSNTYFGNSADMVEARYLSATFRLEGQATNLLKGLREGADWVQEIGLSPSTVQALKQAAMSVTQPVLEEGARQLLWPVSDGYVSLTPLPSTKVLDALKVTLENIVYRKGLPGRYMPCQFLKVGGANPQNVGAFNAACGGSYPLFKAVFPRYSARASESFVRRSWSRHWLLKPSKEAMQELVADNSIWGTAQEQSYVLAMVPGLLHVMLAFVRIVKRAVDESPEQFPPAWHTKHKGFAPYEFLMNPGPEATQALADMVVGYLTRDSIALRKNTDRQATLRLHVAKALEVLQ